MAKDNGNEKLLNNKVKHKDKLCLALILIILSYIVKYGTNNAIKFIITSQFDFREGSYYYKNWQINKYPYRADFYFFNWTNPEQIYDENVKPQFVEVGPYHFDMFINHTDIIYHKENSTVTFSFTKKFIFGIENNSRYLDDVITTINPVANTIAYQARNWNIFTKLAASFTMRASKTQLFVRKTVRELLFEGYEDPLLVAGQKLPISLGMEIPEKFGYFYKRNHTDSIFGPYNMHVETNENFGELYTIKGSTYTEYFPGECGHVQGILGEFISPYQDQEKKLDVYIHDLNVYVPTYYRNQKEINGIVASVYEPKDYIFDNGTRNKSNECFCNGDCVPSGMLNSSASFMKAPFFMSLPHFLLADKYYQDSVDIVKTNQESSMASISVEPNTGILLDGILPVQINMLLQPIKGLGLFSNVPKVFIPVFILKQQVTPKGDYMLLLQCLQYSSIIINSVSLLMIAGSFYMLLCIKFGRSNNDWLHTNYLPVKTISK